MIGLIQRVTEATVRVDGDIVGQIATGLLVLLGVERDDSTSKSTKLADKILNYRIFADQQGKMNLNVRQVGGQLLIVSQFTLVADTQKGNRPSFSCAASPDLGLALYEHFILHCRSSGIHCETGRFGQDMQVALTNDGPVTFQLKV